MMTNNRFKLTGNLSTVKTYEDNCIFRVKVATRIRSQSDHPAGVIPTGNSE